MSYLDDKIAKYYSLQPTRFSVLKSLVISQGINRSTGEMQQQVAIVLSMDEALAGEMLYLDLMGVRDFQFQQPPFSVVTVPHVAIRRASDEGRTEGRFVVVDSEQEKVLICMCQDFSAVVD